MHVPLPLFPHVGTGFASLMSSFHFYQVGPGAGRVTKLSALPPAPVSKEVADPSSTQDSTNGDVAEPSTRDVADMTKAELAQERRSLLMKLFADTGTAKIPAVIR